jgi:hypothetical protein
MLWALEATLPLEKVSYRSKRRDRAVWAIPHFISYDTTHVKFPQRCLSIAPCPSYHIPSQLPLHLYLYILSLSSSLYLSSYSYSSYADPWGLGDYTRDYRRSGVAQSHKEEDQEGQGERATVARWINGIVPVRTTMPCMLRKRSLSLQ